MQNPGSLFAYVLFGCSCTLNKDTLEKKILHKLLFQNNNIFWSHFILSGFKYYVLTLKRIIAMDLLCTYMFLHCTYILKIQACNYSCNYVITSVITQLTHPLHFNLPLNLPIPRQLSLTLPSIAAKVFYNTT